MKTHLPRTAVWLRVACILPLLAAAALSAASAQDWECQECPRRSVAVFDVSVPDPASDATLLISEHKAMEMVDTVILGNLMYEDPSRECIDFVSAVFTQTEASGAGNHNFGQGGLPGLPPGAVPGADYVVSGEIAADDDGNYVLTVHLQAGGTREEVASGSMAWDLSAGAKVNASRAAQLLMPLLGKIREFERRKRDTMTAVAIWPNRGMEVIPDPPLVNRGGTSEVTIRLTDCDGVRLKNRIVAPTAKGGILVPPEMPVTDGNGEMKVSFSLSDSKKRGTVFAEYHYVLPFSSREESGANGSAVVATGDHFVWVRIAKKVTIRSWYNDRDEGEGQWEKVVNARSDEVVDVEVTMTPDYSTVEVDKEFDIAGRRFIPRKYSYTLREEDAPQITRNMFRTSYSRYEESHDGDRVIDSSGSGSGRFTVDRVGNDSLKIRVDPSGQVTQVSLPAVELAADYELRTSCTKTENGKTEDCSGVEKYTRQFSMQPGQAESGEGDCWVPTEQDRMRVRGECRWVNDTEGRREEHQYDWSIVLFGRK